MKRRFNDSIFSSERNRIKFHGLTAALKDNKIEPILLRVIFVVELSRVTDLSRQQKQS